MLSLVKTAQSWKTIDSVLNQRVDWGHESKLQPDCVTCHLQAAFSKFDQVADGKHRDYHKPRIHEYDSNKREDALDRIICDFEHCEDKVVHSCHVFREAIEDASLSVFFIENYASLKDSFRDMIMKSFVDAHEDFIGQEFANKRAYKSARND